MRRRRTVGDGLLLLRLIVLRQSAGELRLGRSRRLLLLRRIIRRLELSRSISWGARLRLLELWRRRRRRRKPDGLR